MGQQNHFVRTSQYVRWTRLRRLEWLVPLAAGVRMWQEYHTYYVEDVTTASNPAIGLLAVAIALACP